MTSPNFQVIFSTSSGIMNQDLELPRITSCHADDASRRMLANKKKNTSQKMCPENKATMSTAFTCHDWPIPLWDSRQEGLRQSLNFNVHLHLQPPAIAPTTTT